MSEVLVKRALEAPGGWDNSLLHGTTASLSLYHTTFWANRLADLLGYDAVYLTVEEGGAPLLRMIVFCRLGTRSAVGVLAKAKCVARRIMSGTRGELLWFGQPVEVSSTVSRNAYAAIADAIEGLANERRLRFAGGEWPCQQEEGLPSGWKSRRWASLRVDLTADPADIFAGFKASARKAIRRAERDGITVCRVRSIEELRGYYSFAATCAKRYRKSMLGFSDFATMWKYIRTNGHFETFVAKESGEMISGLSVWGYGERIGELGSFQSERAFREKLYGGDLTKWSVIQWGHEQGCRSFDLAGVSPDAADAKECSIRRFKEKWGGVYYEYLALSS